MYGDSKICLELGQAKQLLQGRPRFLQVREYDVSAQRSQLAAEPRDLCTVEQRLPFSAGNLRCGKQDLLQSAELPQQRLGRWGYLEGLREWTRQC